MNVCKGGRKPITGSRFSVGEIPIYWDVDRAVAFPTAGR
jgi:hypothetical protein